MNDFTLSGSRLLLIKPSRQKPCHSNKPSASIADAPVFTVALWWEHLPSSNYLLSSVVHCVAIVRSFQSLSLHSSFSFLLSNLHFSKTCKSICQIYLFAQNISCFPALIIYFSPFILDIFFLFIFSSVSVSGLSGIFRELAVILVLFGYKKTNPKPFFSLF